MPFCDKKEGLGYRSTYLAYIILVSKSKSKSSCRVSCDHDISLHGGFTVKFKGPDS